MFHAYKRMFFTVNTSREHRQHASCRPARLGSMNQPQAPEDEDPYGWLEDVTGETALDWVRERNAETVAALTGSARFTELRDELRQVLDADDRIP